MSRRIEIELTSVSNDGTHTWRAAGAREPKGSLNSSLLPAEAKVGDVLRVEAEFYVDGIEITSVMAPKAERQEPDRLEITGMGRDDGGVTTTLVGRRGGGRRGDGGDRSNRGDRGDRPSGGRTRDRRPGSNRGDGDSGAEKSPRQRRDKPQHRERPPAPVKPKARRLRPKRVHRDAAVKDLPQIQHPLALEVLRGGIPGLRKLIETQNTGHRTAGRPEVDSDPLLELAERLLPRLKTAEWRDRADAALAGIDDLDLRDLRSVVVAAESAARTEETRPLAEQLRTALAKRVDDEHHAWLNEIAAALTDERTVRALRMSSRPPKAGAPMPAELATRLSEAAGAALTEDTGTQRWGTVLDAVAFSPVRQTVQPQSIPAKPNDEFLDTVRRLSTRVPQIAALFDIEPTEPPRRRRGRRGER
jgi:hypothetical protein